jgi:hypothetical protein
MEQLDMIALVIKNQWEKKVLTSEAVLDSWMLPKTKAHFLASSAFRAIESFLRHQNLPSECWWAFKNMSIAQIDNLLDAFINKASIEDFHMFLVALNPAVRDAMGVGDIEQKDQLPDC